MYLTRFTLPPVGVQEQFINDEKRTCYKSFYPFGVFGPREMPSFTFAPITIFYGGNGSGKSTILNVMAEKLRLRRGAAYNRSAFFGAYVDLCDAELDRRCLALPQDSRIVTSDDVFDYLLNIRGFNEGVDRRRDDVFDEYLTAKYSSFQLRGMEDYEELKRHVDARRMTQSRFVRSRLAENVQERSNGESALAFFTETVQENALYLLDEPENSLSAPRQLELRQFLADSARFYGCQLVIATHSPFLLSLPQARIYDLDAEDVPVRPWTDLENVRTYRAFFQEHEGEFD